MKLNKGIYKRYEKYPEKILQFGEGNFLRAFVDWKIDKMNKELDFNSGVVVVQPIDKGLVEILNQQDGLYTLYLKGIKDGKAVREHSIINSITRGINAYSDYDEYLKIAENPDLRFVISNTTEAGITFNENDRLDSKPQKSFPGKLTALLYHRYKTFKGDKRRGLILIPCELIDRNGDILQETVLKFVELWNLESDFRKWILESNVFCNSLVDRIVPGYPRENIKEIHEELGYEDNLVVEAEHFHLWVIEGPAEIQKEFPAHEIGLNVLFVEDMTPYRTRKVRILNGAHTSMVPVAYLYGIDTVKESVEDDLIGKFIKEAIYNEIIPTLDLSKDELESFADAVLDRFRNPFIRHELMSISLNSMSKFETRVLPSILEYKNRKGELPVKLTFSLAALIGFYKGKRDDEDINLSDDPDILELYNKLWMGYNGTENYLEYIVTTILSNKNIWKVDLNEIHGLTEAVTKYLILIEKQGMQTALQEVMK